MSMIENQISALRDLAELQNISYHKSIINRAADTIESLSAKLAAANIERSAKTSNEDLISREKLLGELRLLVNRSILGETTAQTEISIGEVATLIKSAQAEDCGGGWIKCKDRLSETSEYMEVAPTPYMKRIEIAYMTDTVEYLIGFYDSSKWMDKRHNIIKNVIAWKPFLKLPEPCHDPQPIITHGKEHQNHRKGIICLNLFQ